MTPVEMLGLTEFPRIGDQPYFLTLAPYHFCWFSLQQSPTPPIAARLAPEATPSPDALPAFFMGVSWETLLEGNVRTLIERRRWRRSCSVNGGSPVRPASFSPHASSTGACSAAATTPCF